jgi:hypothetical protein
VEKPPTLQYRTPPSEETPARRRASDFLLAGGMISLLLGLGCLAELRSMPFSTRGPKYFQVGSVLMDAYGVVSFIFGVAYLIGGFIIDHPRRLWETALSICIAIQGTIALATIGWLIYFARHNLATISCIWILVIIAFPMLFLAIAFYQLRRMRREF